MNLNSKRLARHVPTLLALSLLGFASGAYAQGNTYTYDATASELSKQNNGAGNVTGVHATYNDVTQRLTWAATFTQASGITPNGFTLMLGDSKGCPGQLAALYFDATTPGAPILTGYGYNGYNLDNSYKDGSAFLLNQSPDKIFTSLATNSVVNSLTYQKNLDGSYTLGFDIDAKLINEHSPLYPQIFNPWEGAKFGSSIDFSMHSFLLTDTSYSTKGYLTAWNYCNDGKLDVHNGSAQCNNGGNNQVPEPATVSLMAIAGVGALVARRRRK